MHSFEYFRSLYHRTISDSIGLDLLVGHEGQLASLLLWRDADPNSFTWIGTVGTEPVSGRGELFGDDPKDILLNLLNGYASGAVPANIHPETIGGTPPEMAKYSFIPSKPLLTKRRRVRLDAEQEDVLARFVEAIDVPAALAGPALELQSHMYRGGSHYDELRRLKGPLAEILRGWSHLFASAYCISGPRLDRDKPAEYNAALLQAIFITDMSVDTPPPLTDRRLDVMRRFRGIVAIERFKTIADAIEFAVQLDPSWLPPAMLHEPSSVDEWGGLILAATAAMEAAGDDPKKIIGHLPDRCPSSWQTLAQEQASVASPSP
jgi:hypothetical protein